MKKWLTWLREHRKDWPFLVSMIVGFLNTEFATPFVLRGILNLSGRQLALAAGSWATTELCWWIWFSAWLFRKKIRKIATVSEAINLGQEAVKEFDWKEFLKPRRGDVYIIAKLKDFAIKHSIDNFDLDHYQDNPFFTALLNFLKGVGYLFTCLLVFIMGFLPLFWIFGLMICRLLGWRMAYVSLFISNFLKNYLMAQVYEKVGFWTWIIFFLLFITTLSYILNRIVRYLQLQKRPSV